ncbi:MAG: hypothetical protein H5T66_13230, partial [Chloroflexi bacterium]|nr:hypothetical protein [Chloroflexota bacterium]
MGLAVGLVGLGQFGQEFVGLFKSHPEVTRLALCDLSTERLGRIAKAYDIQECYQSLDEICRSDLDALI